MNHLPDNLHPLTQSQLTLWAGQQMHPKAPLHNVVYTFDIQGSIDETIFKKAFAQLIDQTEVFRTYFTESRSSPLQGIKSTMAPNLQVIDFTQSTKDEVDQWVKKHTLSPIDLSQRVFESALLKLKGERYIWFLKLHHLVTDAVTYSILFNRMADLYGRMRNGQGTTLPTSASFASYAALEQEEGNNPKNQASLAYWKKKVDDQENLEKLYGEANDPYTTKARRIEVSLGPKRSEQLKQLAKDPRVRSWTEDSSLFTIFASLYFIFLYRVSGQRKLTIGAPAHNRGNRRFQQTPGLFIEVLPLSIEIGENDTFYSVLQRVRAETHVFLRHIGPGRLASVKEKNSTALLNYIHVDFSDFDGLPTSVNWVHNGHIDSSHSLRLHVYDFTKGGGFQLAFDIKNSLLDEDRASRIPEHFLSLFDAFLAHIELPIGKPKLMGNDRKQETTGTQKTNGYPGVPVLRQFEQWVDKKPHTIALQSKDQILTYHLLNKRANQLAHLLRTKDIGKGSRVALYMHRSPEYVISVLALMKIGAVFVPIASDQPSERLAYIVGNSRCCLVLTDCNLRKKGIIGLENSLNLKHIAPELESQRSDNPQNPIKPESICYILYTSGSTGKPKGVKITNQGLANYLDWAKATYATDKNTIFALFTSIGFDLTVTSVFLPLISGGQLVVYKEDPRGADTSIFRVMDDNLANTIKLTPSHLALLRKRDLASSVLHTLIVGGEDLKVSLAQEISRSFSKEIKIFNEYGPTEATIGCVATRYDPARHKGASVPIGHPIDHMQAFVFDEYENQVPQGVPGELYIGGIGLATGYVGPADMTTAKFIDHPLAEHTKLYRSGDLVRTNKEGELEYLGRKDDQVKLRGHRIELSEIEARLVEHEGIADCAVLLIETEAAEPEEETINCSRCGLPSNYPGTDFDGQGVCHLCRAFDSYKEKVDGHFRNDGQLVALLTSKRGQNPDYDCISLLSGGKDSTYVLARLINMGLKVLAFTLDNGYISPQAKANIDRIVTRLNVDHMYGKTPHMNEIFVDSLQRHKNVCNGCFKTIYTLSTKIALEKQIPFIVTGLSRGQLFETRLTEELFWDDNLDSAKIDDTLLEARKLYHQESDAVKKLLDTSIFDDDQTFEKVQFVDFYRFSNVSLSEMLLYLKEKVGWERPTDTGRSTNCLINQVGIHVHKKEMGYSNYSFPYSWDVRLGHKTRNESLEEINELIDEIEVNRIIKEIGYIEPPDSTMDARRLVAYYTGDPNLSVNEIQLSMAKKLPAYMIPARFKHLTEIPLTKNGKMDKSALKGLTSVQLEMSTPYEAPGNEIEELLEGIWKEVLQLKKIGIHDDFIALGGHSLAAIRVTARINEEIEMNFPLNKVFEYPTIASYANFIEKTLTTLLEN
ncbi:non-ribosomal peptide synthetase [Pseudozobellia thermophila]|uniref:Amino acid adenylation domain-containing protein n=1 Tax=Pseudozobellia thermophila TaxID=192903 RepID=A0A1M6ITY4_9FLAO|nr:non-ribosomal peptide synthetase [Pseudozobellia thermophila]SHJ37819.1 amino acid adenylation domain-containing protein [Pseudozobellia thermophila]